MRKIIFVGSPEGSSEESLARIDEAIAQIREKADALRDALAEDRLNEMQALTESEYSQWEYELHGGQEAETLMLQPTDETAQFLAWHAETVRLAVLAEREACAEIVEQYCDEGDEGGYELVKKIRERGRE
jgi:hypothetical protein